MEHLLYTIELIGIDHVGIGADWDGGGGVDGDIVVAVVANDEASLGRERNSYSSYVRCYSSAIFFTVRNIV